MAARYLGGYGYKYRRNTATTQIDRALRKIERERERRMRKLLRDFEQRRDDDSTLGLA